MSLCKPRPCPALVLLVCTPGLTRSSCKVFLTKVNMWLYLLRWLKFKSTVYFFQKPLEIVQEVHASFPDGEVAVSPKREGLTKEYLWNYLNTCLPPVSECWYKLVSCDVMVTFSQKWVHWLCNTMWTFSPHTSHVFNPVHLSNLDWWSSYLFESFSVILMKCSPMLSFIDNKSIFAPVACKVEEPLARARWARSTCASSGSRSVSFNPSLKALFSLSKTLTNSNCTLDNPYVLKCHYWEWAKGRRHWIIVHVTAQFLKQMNLQDTIDQKLA